jgi:hypothetical protein
MSFIDTLKAFFRAPKVDPAAIAAADAFSAAITACDAAIGAIDGYTNRANHRYAIVAARLTLLKAPLDDPYAPAAYDEAVAAFTDPADFEPYTEAYLDAHTAAMDTLTAALDTLTAAFAAFNPADDLRASAAALCKVNCDIYTLHADAYSHAAYCAILTAMESQLQALKDEWRAGQLRRRADRAAAEDAVTAQGKAAARKAKAAEDVSKAKQSEQKARIAEAKAEVFLAKAKSAAAKVEEASERANKQC